MTITCESGVGGCGVEAGTAGGDVVRVVEVVEEAEAELSINFDFFSFHGAKMCCTSISSISIGLKIQ